jgi:hypothetical protein
MTPSTARTDRNNNPTAMTTGVAKEGGLVEGVDYVKGDSFQVGGITLYTAKLVGDDPVGMTVRVLDHGTFYTKTGGQRWDYVAIPPVTWNGLTVDQKTDVIGWMYRREGGTAMRHLFPRIFPS